MFCDDGPSVGNCSSLHQDSRDTGPRRGKERQEGAAWGGEGDVEGHGACLVGANVGI